MFCKKVVLRNSAKFTGKHLCQRFIFNRVAGLRAVTLLEKSLWRRCFLVNFAKFLETPFSTEHLKWLLLIIFKKNQLFHLSITNIYQRSTQFIWNNGYKVILLDIPFFEKFNLVFKCCIVNWTPWCSDYIRYMLIFKFEYLFKFALSLFIDINTCSNR